MIKDYIFNVQKTFKVKNIEEIKEMVKDYLIEEPFIIKNSDEDLIAEFTLLFQNNEKVKLIMKKNKLADFFYCYRKYFVQQSFMYEYSQEKLIEKAQWKNRTYYPRYKNEPIKVFFENDSGFKIYFWNLSNKKMVSIPLEILKEINSNYSNDVLNIKLTPEELSILDIYMY